ncbi:MAG: flagellar hook-basal body complex protein FliE [Clostridia bacterium]|nr:flagellar hook-basal body complex protein FliE [Clostridia bacterium]
MPESSGGTVALCDSFAKLLKEKIAETNNLQLQADALTQQYLAGKVEDVHQVMLALEQANLSLQLMVQVRNKVIEAYQEIWRMQI